MNAALEKAVREPRVWFITGVSGGIGQAIAKAALARGDIVIGTLRQQAQIAAFEQLAPGRAHGLQLDVTHTAQIGAVVEAALALHGRIDVLVNNAGYGMVGAIEETSIYEVRAIFDTNVFGLLQLTQAVLPHLRARRQGHIINLSSGAGIGAVPGLGIYSATKFAVEGLSEALAGEVAALGIHVSLVEPGAVLTNFPKGSIVETEKKIADYAPVSGHGRAGVQKFYEMQAASAETVANAILKLADDSTPSLRLIVGGDALQGVQRKLDQVRKELQYSTDLAG